MTEDEAFIRAIVDSPGDDTPRLVYADWLDDRDDPRGAHLRAELETVRASRRGLIALSSARKLIRATSTLCPVWVNRVSRPSVGVCCDHLVFRDPFWFNDADHDILATLPPAFHAFQLNYSGGYCAPRHPAVTEDSTTRAHHEYARRFPYHFFGISDAVTDDFMDYYRFAIPTEDGDDMLLVGKTDFERGRVYEAIDLKWRPPDDEGRLAERDVSFVAESLPRYFFRLCSATY